MIQAVIDDLGAQSQSQEKINVAVVTATTIADDYAKAISTKPLLVWRQGFLECIRVMRDFKPDLVVVVGADCIDGHYNPETSSRLIATADIFARSGIPVTFTGFSFNDTPHSRVVDCLGKISREVRINLRDAVSLERFRRVCSAEAHLVADMAFMLKPADEKSDVLVDVKKWIDAQRVVSDDAIIAFNIHPMLFKNISEKKLDELNVATVGALRKILNNHKIKILLLAHDYRQNDGDGRCLKMINSFLKDEFHDRVTYPTTEFTAAQLKRIVGWMDGVVTGRMHLAIGSLGMGVPVATITYQGKFAGLMKHFEYPIDLQISADDAMHPENTVALLDRFLTQLPQLRRKVVDILPSVKDLSRKTIQS